MPAYIFKYLINQWRQNRRHFAQDFSYTFSWLYLIEISLSAFVKYKWQYITMRSRYGLASYKPLSELMVTQFTEAYMCLPASMY